MKFIKSKLVLLILILLVNTLHGQPWLQNLKTEKPTFKEIQNAFYEYWKDKPIEKGKGYKPFKRWEYYFSTRLLDDGNLPSSNITWENWKSYQNSHTEQASRVNYIGNWVASGPDLSLGGYSGLGRINCMAFHPTNPNIFWVGTPAGGLWKTTNGGASWTTNTDYFPVLGISDIAIDPTNPNIIYVATGDGEGAFTSAGDTKSIGVLKSYDGGLTWSYTGLDWTVTSSKLIRRLIINPTNSNILIAATSDGLYRTTDAGNTWARVQPGYFMDAEFKPNDPSIVYAATATWSTGGDSKIYRSVNSGSTWSTVATLQGGYRINLAVTAANSNYVDAIVINSQRGLEGLYFSSNSGASFSKYYPTVTSSLNMLNTSYNGSGIGGQGEYDLAYAVNPNNVNDIWLGGVNTWNSTNGGFNWNIKTMWSGFSGDNPNNVPVVHADKHFFAFHPLVPGTLFECNDGGLYKTTNGGVSWSDLTNTMQISQIYRVGVNQNFTGNVICGLQDNGTKEVASSSWYDQTGGDGMECIIDYTNGNVEYATYVNGEISKTVNGGTLWNIIVNNNGTAGTVHEPGEWVTPYIMHPTLNNTLLVGKSQVYKTINGGTTWSQLGTITGAVGNIIALAYAPSNPQVIYASTRTQIFKTINGGSTWAILNGLASVAAPNTYITVNPTNPNLLYVTQGGYGDSDKVYIANSTNAFTTWDNISGTLPNLPINCIVYQKGSFGGLYIGTDVGVFYRDSSMTDWSRFNSGLPNVVVTELEIANNDHKIWAATFGRGLWSSDIIETYHFIGNGNWDIASNWANNNIPPSTFTKGKIIIEPIVNGSCNLNRVQYINSGGEIVVMPSKKFIVPQNLLIQY